MFFIYRGLNIGIKTLKHPIDLLLLKKFGIFNFEH